MFTGIVEDKGKVLNISNSKLQISTVLTDIKRGDSVAVNGVCLTAVEIKDNVISFDYSPTTADITNISLLKINSAVNLERALQLTSRLGGHIVSGHIDTTTRITNIKRNGDFYFIYFALNKEMKKYIVKKGFIAVDGISLTVAELSDEEFAIAMIPETYSRTIFSVRNIGDIVNIELDVLAKYVEKMVLHKNENKSSVTVDLLKENGFF